MSRAYWDQHQDIMPHQPCGHHTSQAIDMEQRHVLHNGGLPLGGVYPKPGANLHA